ncbi:putative transcriptional regulatory protein Pmob_0807 [Tachypleus tridentatus]|uniref:putative transcriptional regulatory protein Pmob_0807 n=1 Tax=Tachypleus tridentatus TaxID=6853 RepID=UPI003FD4058A
MVGYNGVPVQIFLYCRPAMAMCLLGKFNQHPICQHTLVNVLKARHLSTCSAREMGSSYSIRRNCKTVKVPKPVPNMLVKEYRLQNKCKSEMQLDKEKIFGLGKMTSVFTPQTVYVRHFYSFEVSCPPSVILNHVYQAHKCVLRRGMAGHSKWQNIRHIKGSKDIMRAKIFDKLSRLMRQAVIDGGSADPKRNSKLASLIEKARSNNMPSATIDGVLKKALNKKTKTSIIEVMGPGGCSLIVTVETDNLSRLIHEIKQSCRKYSSFILDEGRAKVLFDEKVIIRAGKTKDGVAIDHGVAIEDAIESGAEDVQEMENEDGIPNLQFISSPAEFPKVKKYLEQAKYPIEETGLEFLPHARVPLSEEHMQLTGQLINLLEDIPDVVKIFDNIE